MAIRESKCPPHYWIIDSENVGHCKYCPEVRDFGRLLQRGGCLWQRDGVVLKLVKV